MTALYIFATVFGLGVVLVDFFMMMSSGAGDDSSGHGSDSDGHGSDDSSSHHDSSSDDASHHGDHHGHHPDGSVVGHQQHHSRRAGLLLKTLGMFRHVIYFCVGFGPIGLFAALVEESSFAILWALGGGIVVSVIAAMFRHIQKDKMDSSINESELLMEKATVLVSMAPGKMGKVRILHGGMNIDRYAMSKSEIDEFKAGDEAVVSEIREDYVIIEPTI